MISQGVKDTVGQHIGNEIELVVAEQITEKVIEHQIQEIIKFQEVLANEIAREINKTPSFLVDLSTPINAARATELAKLSSNIRQLQDLTKYMNNFTNLENLIPEDILYLNRLHSLLPYKNQLLAFLREHKIFFIHDGQQYFIEDIASYHIHAGDYFLKNQPRGGHSNYHGCNLDYFNPVVIKNSLHGSKDVLFRNSRFIDEVKKSSIYPEIWSEFVCDLKAIDVITNVNTVIVKGDRFGPLNVLVLQQKI